MNWNRLTVDDLMKTADEVYYSVDTQWTFVVLSKIWKDFVLKLHNFQPINEYPKCVSNIKLKLVKGEVGRVGTIRFVVF